VVVFSCHRIFLLFFWILLFSKYPHSFSRSIPIPTTKNCQYNNLDFALIIKWLEQSETTANSLSRLLLFHVKIIKFQTTEQTISWICNSRRSLMYDMWYPRSGS
jgi:hypothetical protein